MPEVQRWEWLDSDDAIKAHAALAGCLALGAIPWTHQFSWACVVYFISLAVCSIYIGAHKGLTAGMRQQLTGLLAPFIASVSLLSIYLVVTYFPGFSIQTFLDIYFFLLGSFVISTGAASLLKVAPPLRGKFTLVDGLPDWLLKDENEKPIKRLRASPAGLLGTAIGLGLAGAELASHHQQFTLTNLVACMVVSDILQRVGIRSFRSAAVLCAGLLIYDVFWVFGSSAFTQDGQSVMLTVATSDALNAPTRLLFPRPLPADPSVATDIQSFGYSLLGLGDVAVPGLLACLCLRYDASRTVDLRPRAEASISAIEEAMAGMPEGANKQQMGEAAASAAHAAYDKLADADDARRAATTTWGSSSEQSGDEARNAGAAAASDSAGGADALTVSGAAAASGTHQVTDAVLQQRRYFGPVMLAYSAGLVVSYIANYITRSGQPALLYLCPLTFGAVVAVALSRGEIRRVLSFTDVPSMMPSTTASGADNANAASKSDNNN